MPLILLNLKKLVFTESSIKELEKNVYKMKKIHLYDKIISPLLLKNQLIYQNKIKLFLKFQINLNKINLKKNIEKIFKVNVVKVNIINKQSRKKITRGKKVKIQGYKKAIVTLKKGQSIDLTTGI